MWRKTQIQLQMTSQGSYDQVRVFEKTTLGDWRMIIHPQGPNLNDATEQLITTGQIGLIHAGYKQKALNLVHVIDLYNQLEKTKLNKKKSIEFLAAAPPTVTEFQEDGEVSQNYLISIHTSISISLSFQFITASNLSLFFSKSLTECL